MNSLDKFVSVMILSAIAAFTHGHSDRTLVLLISFDGFRYDYLDKVKAAGKSTPNFDKLIEGGVTVKGNGLKNAFITKTFPNHYTIATGLYEESHGIVHNSFFDPVYNETFRNTPEQSSDSKWWDNGDPVNGPEPIWTTNERGSESSVFPKRSGVFFWPGSQAPVRGRFPHHHIQQYDSTVKNETRIDTVLEWFSTEDNPINLGLVYFEEPDEMGHSTGPNSMKILDTVVALDGLVGYLLTQLEKHEHLNEHMNIIITSDHGMKELTHTIYLDQYVDSNLYIHYGSSPVWLLAPAEGQLDNVYEKLKIVKNLSVYKKEEIPSHFHYTNNRRITPLVIVADEGYAICHNMSTCYMDKGGHGYSNEDPEMHPIFIAHGPKFKKHFEAEPFETVDIYPLLCHILDVPPAPNNGSLDRVRQLLYVYDNSLVTSVTIGVTVGGCALISLIYCAASLYLQRKKKSSMTRYSEVIMSVMKGNDSAGKTHLLLDDVSSSESEMA